MPPPVGFDFETAKEILRLVKKNKNGSLNRPIDSETPILNVYPQLVWAYVPENIDCTFDEEVQAWLIPNAVYYYGLNLGLDEFGVLAFGPVNSEGYIGSGIQCLTYHPGESNIVPPRISKGSHLGLIFGLNAEDITQILIAPPIYTPPPEFNATMDVVTSVYATAEGIEVTTATLYADASAIIAKEFIGLDDVGPDSFTGNQGRVVKVDDTGSFLEFGPIVDAEYTTFIALSDTPASYDESAGKFLKVNAGGGGIEFVAIDIEQLITDVATLQTDVATLQTDVATLQADVATLQADVATLQADYITLEARVTALE